MSNQNGYEIEYKYLISYPDISLLTAQEGCRVADIEQIYLDLDPSMNSRVRSWEEHGIVHYYLTKKKRISAQTAEEYETEISKDEYDRLLIHTDLTRSPIKKTRYIIPYKGHDLEIDVYPFWKRQAVLEIEVSEENEAVDIPSYISVLKDVTADKKYKNHSLAKVIPEEI